MKFLSCLALLVLGAAVLVSAEERLDVEKNQATLWETAELVDSLKGVGSSSITTSPAGSSSAAILQSGSLPPAPPTSPNPPGSSSSSGSSSASSSSSASMSSASAASSQIFPMSGPPPPPPTKQRVVVMVNRNLLTDNQVPRNRAEEYTKRTEQDLKLADQQADAESRRQESARKADAEASQKAEVAKQKQAELEEERKFNLRRKEEGEQKEKARLTESEQKKKDNAREQTEKDRLREKQEEEKSKADAKEQDAKREEGEKKATEEKFKSNPCNDQQRKFVPNPTTKAVEVQAMRHSIQGSGFPLDTGVFVKSGNALSISASGVWYAAVNDLQSDANGLPQMPNYNAFGLSARYGTLVGRIGNGPWFIIGTSYYTCKVEQEGRLFLVYWDSDSDNNRGQVSVSIKYTKDPQENDRCFQKQVADATTKTFMVAAKENSVSEAGSPVETNIFLARDTALRITASGEWYASTDTGLYANPNGRQWDWNGLRLFSLVGRIGVGGWFFVGEDFFLCSLNQEGPLQLAYWDVNSGDNRGNVQVSVNYQRKNAQREDDCARKGVTGGSSRTLQVFARQNSVSQNGRPLDTGIDITSARPLKITATGTWYAANGRQLAADANGWSNLYGTQGSTLRAFSLVGKIGNGPWFFIGTDYYVCFPRSNGRLYLGYWDSDSDNNEGNVDATIAN